MHLLKQLCQSCCVPITNLINLSLEQGIVPDAMKLAKVIPIYKAKSRESFSNYRPISLLEAAIGFWGNIWVFLKNFVKCLRYMQVKLNKFASNI